MLLAAPLPHAVRTGQCPSPAQTQCLFRYVQAQTVNNGGEQTTTTEQKNAPTLPTSKRKNKTNVEKQCKKKELDQAREKTWINIGASFQSRSGGICKDSRATQSWLLFCWTSKDTYLICFILCFNHKAMVVAVTVILAIAHIILRYCSPAM